MEKTLTAILKIDVAYFSRGGFWLAVGQILSLFTSLLLAVIFAQKLDPQTYGQYRYLSSITAIIGTLSLTGLGTALAQAVASNKDRTLLLAFKRQLVWSLPTAAIGIILALTAFVRGNPIYGIAFLIFSLSFPINNAASLYDNFLNGRRDFLQSVKYSLLYSLLFTIILGSAALFKPEQFLIVFPITFLFHALFNLLIYKKTADSIPRNSLTDTDIIRYGKHLSFSNILAIVADQLDSTILFILAGPARLAVYSFAIAGPEIIKNLFKSTIPLAIPKLAVMDELQLKRSLPHHALKIFLFSLVIVSAYLVAAPTVFKILFPNYLSSVFYSQIFSLSLLFVPSYLFTASFQAKKEIRKIYVVNISTNFLAIIMTISLTYLWGLPGLVVSRIISRFFIVLISVVAFYFV